MIWWNLIEAELWFHPPMQEWGNSRRLICAG